MVRVEDLRILFLSAGSLACIVWSLAVTVGRRVHL